MWLMKHKLFFHMFSAPSLSTSFISAYFDTFRLQSDRTLIPGRLILAHSFLDPAMARKLKRPLAKLHVSKGKSHYRSYVCHRQQLDGTGYMVRRRVVPGVVIGQVRFLPTSH
ncbi:hypothetical protein F4775DRAFT_548257 [Biscogniauxia sp. FL1348]|nr:hypothetical protein F4775DRAFT_548257 [Biscogniauxia sp. FL1348]